MYLSEIMTVVVKSVAVKSVDADTEMPIVEKLMIEEDISFIPVLDATGGCFIFRSTWLV